MVRFVSCLLLLLAGLGVNAQLWNKTYIEDRPVLLFSSVVSDDSSYWVTGVTMDKGEFTNYDRAFIGKLNNYGEFDYYRSIQDSVVKIYAAYFNALLQDSRGDFVFAGYSGDSLAKLLFVKYYKAQDSIAEYEYSMPNSSVFQGRCMIQHTDGFYYIAGARTGASSNDVNVVLLKVDSNGNRQWLQLYNQPQVNYAQSIISLKNGNLMLGAFSSNSNLTNSNTWLIEIDTSGLIVRQWLDTGNNTYTAEGLKQTTDGGFIYSAQKKVSQSGNTISSVASIVRMDTGFNKVWIYNSVYPSIYTGLFDLEILGDGSIVACGQRLYYDTDSTTILSGWLIKLDTSGHVIWDRVYTGINATSIKNFLTDIDVLPDGGLIAVGQCQRPGHTPPQVGWFLKLDSNGCEIANCLMGVGPQTSATGEDLNSQLQVWPNPFNTDLSLTLSKGEGIIPIAMFTITTITGQVVYQQTETNLARGYTKMLDLSYLPNGVYFVEVSTGQGKVVKRVVKE